MSRKILSSGVVVQGYQIEGVLGQGGFGITYLATELDSMSSVAIKEYFPKNFATRQGGNTIRSNVGEESRKIFGWGLRGFLEEAKVLARLNHPNVIGVKKFFETNGTAYFVMDYCDGESLERQADQLDHVSPSVVFKIFDGVLSGLEHVHQFGIIHGDLKPANIFLRNNSDPVLLDFGSARHEIIRNYFRQVSDGYSSPEQYADKARLGSWTDIYGLGATFYKILTGRKPPNGNERIIRDTYTPCTQIQLKGYDVRFLRLIDRCLSVDYHERPQSVAELRSAFKEIPTSAIKIGGFGASAPINSVSRSRRNHATFQNTSGPSIKKFVLTAMVVVVLAGGGALFFNYKAHDQADSSESTIERPVPLSINQNCEVDDDQLRVARLCEAYHQNSLPECRAEIELRFRSEGLALYPSASCGLNIVKPSIASPRTSSVAGGNNAASVRITAKLVQDSCYAPTYPEISKVLGEEGTVSVRVLVDTDGSAISTSVIKSSGHSRLDDAMREAVSRCRFTPGSLTEPSWAGVRYTFKPD